MQGNINEEEKEERVYVKKQRQFSQLLKGHYALSINMSIFALLWICKINDINGIFTNKEDLVNIVSILVRFTALTVFQKIVSPSILY